MAEFNLYINPETGDHELDEHGNFRLDYTAQTPILLQLREERGANWASQQAGSRIQSRFRGRPPVNPREALHADIVEALRPLVRAGRLRTFSVSVTDEPLAAAISAIDANGNALELAVDPVG